METDGKDGRRRKREESEKSQDPWARGWNPTRREEPNPIGDQIDKNYTRRSGKQKIGLVRDSPRPLEKSMLFGPRGDPQLSF